MPAGIFLMQWYDPLNKFMLLKHFECTLPSPLNVFKMIITPEMEYPMVCVSVKQPYQQNKLKLDLINMNSGASWFHSDELEDMDGSGISLYIIAISSISFISGNIWKFDFVFWKYYFFYNEILQRLWYREERIWMLLMLRNSRKMQYSFVTIVSIMFTRQ